MVMVFRGCADFVILHPTTDAIDAAGATRVEVPIGSEGIVECWTQRTIGCREREPEAFVLTFCGNGERAEDAVAIEVERWQRWPVEVWAENHPGYGGSTTPCTLSSLAPAALAAFDAAARRAAGRPIFLTGISLGTADALYLSARRPAAGLVLHNPPPLRELIVGHYGWWNLGLLARPVSKQIPSDLDGISNARASNAPAVFILADRDTLVPPKFQKMVLDAYAGPKRRVDFAGAGHNTPVYGIAETQVQDGIDWLWQHAMTPATAISR